MFLLGGLYRRLYRWQILLDADAQLQLPAQLPQAGGDGGDILGNALPASSSPFRIVDVPALVCQGVDLRLERVMLHGQLRRCFNVVFHQVDELPLAAVKPPDFIPQQKNRPIPRTAGGDFPQQI